MANSKITDLSSLTAAAGDEIPVNRAGSDGKITVGGIVDLVKLSANATYYVRSDGSDSNTGLTNTAGGAFLTLHKAFQTIENIDRGTYTITIEVGAGTFEGSYLRHPKGSGRITINGAGAGSTTFTPDLTNSTGDTFLFDDCYNVRFTGGFTFAASGSGFVAYIEADRSQIQLNATIAITGDATDIGFISIRSMFQVIGGAITIGSAGLGQFILVSTGGNFSWATATLTMTSTPNVDAFGGGAVNVEQNSYARFSFGSITGSSTGIKYLVEDGSYLLMANKTIATWPLGDTAGVIENGSQVEDTAYIRDATQATVALSDGATPALDASAGDVFTLTAAGNRTIAVPSNASDGQKIVIRHTASGADRTLALNTGAGGFRYGTDITGLTVTASGKTDYIGAIYNSTDSKWDVVSYVKGF